MTSQVKVDFIIRYMESLLDHKPENVADFYSNVVDKVTGGYKVADQLKKMQKQYNDLPERLNSNYVLYLVSEVFTPAITELNLLGQKLSRKGDSLDYLLIEYKTVDYGKEAGGLDKAATFYELATALGFNDWHLAYVMGGDYEQIALLE